MKAARRHHKRALAKLEALSLPAELEQSSTARYIAFRPLILASPGGRLLLVLFASILTLLAQLSPEVTWGPAMLFGVFGSLVAGCLDLVIKLTMRGCFRIADGKKRGP